MSSEVTRHKIRPEDQRRVSILQGEVRDLESSLAKTCELLVQARGELARAEKLALHPDWIGEIETTQPRTSLVRDSRIAVAPAATSPCGFPGSLGAGALLSTA